jgi:hypothetical protein
MTKANSTAVTVNAIQGRTRAVRVTGRMSAPMGGAV